MMSSCSSMRAEGKIRSARAAVSFRKASTTTTKGVRSKALAVMVESAAWLTMLLPFTQTILMGGSAAAISGPTVGSQKVRNRFFSGSLLHSRLKQPREWRWNWLPPPARPMLPESRAAALMYRTFSPPWLYRCTPAETRVAAGPSPA